MAVGNNGTLGTRERLLMESETRWLQKALFALSKARADRDKLEAASDEDIDPVRIKIRGRYLDLATVRVALAEAVMDRAEATRERLQRRSPLLR